MHLLGSLNPGAPVGPAGSGSNPLARLLTENGLGIGLH